MMEIPESLLNDCILVLFINLGERGSMFYRIVGQLLQASSASPL
jgi:hypothetical protein